MWVLGILLLGAIVLYAYGCVIAARCVFSQWGALKARQRLHFVIVFVAVAVFVVGLANFAAFFTASVAIGGDALSGRVEAGRYYVSSHGQLTEVSPEVWAYSRWHAVITWATSVLATLAMAVMVLSDRLLAREQPGPRTHPGGGGPQTTS
jgi:hypothetical protein